MRPPQQKGEPYPDSDFSFQTAFAKSLRYLGFRPRTVKEIKDYLVKRNFCDATINKVLARLEEQKFINDSEFVIWWIEQRQQFRPKSKSILKMELLQKGVERELIETLLEEQQDDLKIATKFFEKKKNKFGDLSNKENFQKAIEYLQRRGFNWEVIKKVLKKIDD